jgi:hypothetical protein
MAMESSRNFTIARHSALNMGQIDLFGPGSNVPSSSSEFALSEFHRVESASRAANFPLKVTIGKPAPGCTDPPQ